MTFQPCKQNIDIFSHSVSLFVFSISLLSTGCSYLPVIDPIAATKKSCEEYLRQQLKDPDSYRRDSELAIAQEIPGQPIVYGWRFNAKNSYGGYGNGSEALCYQDSSKAIEVHIVDDEKTGDKNVFLAKTNPELQNRLNQIDSEYQSSISGICEKFRIEWTSKAADIPDFCYEYFANGRVSPER